jgi:ferric-dicitrate binding protein FerR (iron transport regulator)
MDKKQYYTGLILKLLTGDIQPDEQIELDIWLRENNDHQKLFEDIKSNWELYPAADQEAEFAYQRLIHRLDLPYQQSQSSPTDTSASVKRISLFQFRAAAAITGLLLLTFLTYYLVNSPSRTIYQTGYGETATYQLPDSSVVTLNANSSLEFTQNWQKQELREVWLDGEAFFQVTKTSQLSVTELPDRFVVHTPQADVEVLGTSFNVEDRRGTTTVVLNSGKVKLKSRHTQDTGVVMQPGDYVALSESSDTLVRKFVDPKQFTSWTEYKLVMDNTPLRSIAQTIEDYYGLKVQFETSATADITLTGSIPTRDLNDFLTVLSASADVQIDRQENTLTLRNKAVP